MRREFGNIETLPSGSKRAIYVGPDMQRHRRTFKVAVPPGTNRDRRAEILAKAETDASAWLLAEGEKIRTKTWSPPLSRQQLADRYNAEKAAAAATRIPTLAEYAPTYLENRRKRNGKPLESSGLRTQQGLIRNHLEPTFGPVPMDQVTDEMVEAWWDGFAGTDRVRHEAYTLAKSMWKTATSPNRRRSKVTPMPGARVPFNIEGAGRPKSEHREERATDEQLQTILATIRPQWRGVVLLGIWGGLRISEILALRRSDVDLDNRRIHIRRALGVGTEGLYEKGTKNDLSKIQYLPKPAVDELRKHLGSLVTGRDGLLFPAKSGGWLQRSVFVGELTGTGFYAARHAAGRDDLHFHDLRATGASLLAERGVPLKELQEWLRDSTPTAALRYIRIAEGKMQQHADTLSRLAEEGGW